MRSEAKDGGGAEKDCRGGGVYGKKKGMRANWLAELTGGRGRRSKDRTSKCVNLYFHRQN
jgi:hypothetical protein